MAARVYLDTNVFIRAFEGSDALTRALIDMMAVDHAETSAVFATSELTLAEMLVHPYRLNDEITRQRYDDLIQPGAWLQVGPVNREVLKGAALLRSTHKPKLPDAIHISTALHFGCQFILTADRGIEGTYHLKYRALGENWIDRSVTVVRADIDNVIALTERLRP